MNAFWRRKCILVLAILPISSSCLFAQTRMYTLSDLVDSAMKYYPQLLRKNALVEYSKAAVTDVRHSFLPGLRIDEQLTIGTDNSLAGSYFPFGMVPSTSAGIRADNKGQPATGDLAILYGQYGLATFGYRKALINRARADVDVLEADANRELYYLKIQVARSYFALLKNEYKRTADQENVIRYQKIFNVIQALTRAGIRPGSDSSLALAELSRTEVTFNQTKGAVENSKAQLSYLTGLDTASIHVDSAVMKEQVSSLLLLKNTADSNANPLLDYLQKLKALEGSNERLISKSFLPKISLTATAWARGSGIAFNDQYKSAGYGFGYQRYNYLAGMSVQYDLFNGIHKKDRLKAYRFQTDASALALQAQQLALKNAALQAANNILVSERNLQELMIQQRAAQATYGQKIAQYKAGIINVVDLTNAAYVLYRSMNDHAETLGDWYLGQLDKAAATGNLDSFIQAIK